MPTGYDTQLFVVNNTFLNDKQSGTFVANATSTPTVLENNVFANGGTISSQASPVSTTNFDSSTQGDPMFTDVASYDVTLKSGSPCINRGTMPGSSDAGQSLAPAYEYVHPRSDVPRIVVGAAIDIGAYELGVSLDGGAGGGDDGGLTSGEDGGSASTFPAEGGTGESDAGAVSDASSSSGGCGCVVGKARCGGWLPIALGAIASLLARRRRRV